MLKYLLHFLGFDFVESLTCYRAFVSLTATASSSTKLFRSRTKERERKINLVTGPTLCKPHTSIHQKSPRLIWPGLSTNSEYTTCQWDKKRGILWRFLLRVYLSFTKYLSAAKKILQSIENGYLQVYQTISEEFVLALAIVYEALTKRTGSIASNVNAVYM